MSNQTSANRIRALEGALRDAGLDLYLVPMVDEFQSEYIPAHAARLPYVTGFTGSAGTGMFWAKSSGERRHTLFVDGRYTLQAATEVDGGELVVINSGEVSLKDWLATQPANLRIGFDPWLVTMQQLTRWEKAADAQSSRWVAAKNLVDSIWNDRPATPSGEIVLHSLEYAGVHYSEKRTAMLDAIIKQNADALLLTQPDAINWLLNIRGGDIPFNPLVLSYLLLTRDGSATLFSYAQSVNDEVKQYFADHQVTLADVNILFAGQSPFTNGMRVLVDPEVTPQGMATLAEKSGAVLLEAEDPTQLPKSQKNGTELAGIRDAHRRDGLALTRFLHWFAGQVESKKLFSELEVVEKLEAFRQLDPEYRGPSFATIAGAGPHGAIIHYRADEKSNRRARLGDLFLLDSGGQYRGGTTDVTRTIAIGVPTTAMKDHVTRVLKGHIALATVQFPRGTSGSQLDVLARQYLWQAGLDFDHGTGHGVGAYLCVHEGPQRISKRGNNVALLPGMILSNEPGYYLQGHYGIRIENLVAVVEGKANALGFETLTLAPIDTSLVEVAMLTSEERNWLNQYHQRVYQTHAPNLDDAQRDWLERTTRAI